MVALVMAIETTVHKPKVQSQRPQEVKYRSCLEDTLVKAEVSVVAVNETEVQDQRWTQTFSW